tara:strand:- start:262 stop:780 length:519 start_codon:yes stop_codon:yes gene_type:complete
MELFNCSYCKNGKGNFYSTNKKLDFQKHLKTAKHLKCVECNETGKNICKICNKSFNDEEYKRHMEINKDYLEMNGFLRERRLKNYTCGNYIVYHDYCPKGRRFKNMDDFYEWEQKREEAKEEQSYRKLNNEKGVRQRLKYHLKKVEELKLRLDRYELKRTQKELKELKNKKR